MATHPPSGHVTVIGHVEWVTHARGRVPRSGEIVDLADPLAEPAGGGGVAACAAARLGAPTTLITALGNDHAARQSGEVLQARGIRVLAAWRSVAQTPALSVAGDDGERTILVVGPRLQVLGGETREWDRVDPAGGAYYAGEDPAALRRARRAGVLVVSARRVDDLIQAGVTADVVVGSGADPAEDTERLPDHLIPAYRIITEGPRGGRIVDAGGSEQRYEAVAVPGEVVDTYGCGDTFAAALTVGLARGLDVFAAARMGAAAAAECASWRGGIGPM